MNLFVLNENPVIAAQEQCDKHINKMVIESAQMLSTTHRMLDGTMYYGIEAQIALTVILSGNAEVKADRLRMTNV